MDSSPQSRYACDYCRQKRKKCSRELPRCAACKPWPGPCTYSRDHQLQVHSHQPARGQQYRAVDSRPRPKPATPTSAISLNSAFEDPVSTAARLEKVEASLQTLTDSVNKLLLLAEKSADAPGRREPGVTRPVQKQDNTPTHPFASVREANSHLGQIAHQQTPLAEYQVAQEHLKALSQELESFRLDTALSKDFGDGLRRSYLVPDPETGQAVMTRFLTLVEYSKAFFTAPSNDLLFRVIFEPAGEPPGWVIFVNYQLLATPNHDLDPALAKMWRWNVGLALQNASLFLAPSIANIQAFMLLSFHGEDFASPNISWMLTSHACRQAQALSIHSPASKLDEESRQRQLCLFWALFNMEKRCAVAFGRPILLPWSLYESVPMPSFSHLTKWFKPHLHGLAPSQLQATSSVFGAHVFLQSIEFSRLTSTVLDALAQNPSLTQRETLKKQLDDWLHDALKVYAKTAENEELCQNTNSEMRSFDVAARFRYLHVMILLGQDCPEQEDLRVTCARQMIEILQELVFTWDPLYNGVAWHLLYYPFTPFFVLFGHIIQKPGSPSVSADLALLQLVVAYFSLLGPKMTLLSGMVLRLERTAEVFVRLAQRHVHAHTGQQPTCQEPPVVDPQNDSIASQHRLSVPETQPSITLDGIDVDKFLGWAPQQLSDAFLQGGPTQAPADTGDGVSVPQGRKRPYDTTFDWFAWESYYSDV